jgi:hypothetical protein
MEEGMSTKSTSTTRRKKAPQQNTLARCRLLRAHEHQGQLLVAGTEIDVHPETARWLCAVGAAVTTPTTPEGN